MKKTFLTLLFVGFIFSLLAQRIDLEGLAFQNRGNLKFLDLCASQVSEVDSRSLRIITWDYSRYDIWLDSGTHLIVSFGKNKLLDNPSGLERIERVSPFSIVFVRDEYENGGIFRLNIDQTGVGYFYISDTAGSIIINEPYPIYYRLMNNNELAIFTEKIQELFSYLDNLRYRTENYIRYNNPDRVVRQDGWMSTPTIFLERPEIDSLLKLISEHKEKLVDSYINDNGIHREWRSKDKIIFLVFGADSIMTITDVVFYIDGYLHLKLYDGVVTKAWNSESTAVPVNLEYDNFKKILPKLKKSLFEL